MDADRWASIESIYYAALSKRPGERLSYVAAACADDPALRREIESLLACADAHLTGPANREQLEQLWDQAGTSAVAPKWGDQHALPTSIGRYRVIRLLGEGGMGVVYEAEQDQPRRTVALKIIKPGFAGREQLRRFEQESEAIARLHHPGIAQIYDAGTADSGFGLQPYFAMEFIRGESLLDYSKANKLSMRQRLEVMAKVCDAIQHAHQAGIIHRDLKPGNILVDEQGQPKVLDFGVARVTDSDAMMTRQTEFGQLVGTLAYMSPEQALADPLELDTRSDVYALGVILFELLAGRLPYEVGGQLHEAVQTIREKDPLRLSSISRVYRGDVETIVAKAMEKDKSRRYASAAAIAADIRRYLNEEPIAARAPSASYQFQKFARRHKPLVAGAAAVLIVLIAGIVTSTWEAARARRAEQVAATEAASAKAVNDFLQNDLLAQASANVQAHPDTAPDPDLKVRTALDRAAKRLNGKFGAQPEVEASIRQTIGTSYKDLGLFAEAQQQMERALLLRRRVLGEGRHDTLITMHELGEVYWNRGEQVKAEALLARTLEMQRRVLGEEHGDTLDTLDLLAQLYGDEGKYGEAERLYIRILEIRRRTLGPENRNTLATMSDLATLYWNEGKYAQAEPLWTKALPLEERVLGDQHPDTLTGLNNLGTLYQNEGKYAESEALFVKAIESQRHVLGEGHPSTLNTMNNLAVTYGFEGKYAQAEHLFEKIVDRQRRSLGPEHPKTLNSVTNLAMLYAYEGKCAKSELQLRQVLEVDRHVVGEQNPSTLNDMNDLALVYRYQGKYAEAEPLYVKLLELQGRVLGAAHPRRLASMNDFALVYLAEERYATAETLLREALATQENSGSSAWVRYNCEALLGASLVGQQKYPDAEPLLLSGYNGMLQRQKLIPAASRFNVEEAEKWIVRLYERSGRPQKAAEWREKQQRTVHGPATEHTGTH